MAIQQQCFIFTWLAALDVAFGVISCNNPQPVVLRPGDEGTSSAFCTMPEGCAGGFNTTIPEGMGYPLNVNLDTPIMGKYESSMGAGFANYTLRSTFLGFVNMLHDEQKVTRNFEWPLSCISKSGNESRTVVNFTVTLSRPESYEAAVVPPSEIDVPCLVQGVETPVSVSFGTPNSSLTYRSLVAGWKRTDGSIPWVYSRPLSAIRTTSTSTNRYDGGAQPIMQSIESGPSGYSLVVNMKPPESNDFEVSWQVCIVPGDGYNWFPQLCTQAFAVKKSQAECDATTTTTTTSGSISFLHGFRTWCLAMIVLVSVLVHQLF
jgi:hypothetical protein